MSHILRCTTDDNLFFPDMWYVIRTHNNFKKSATISRQQLKGTPSTKPRQPSTHNIMVYINSDGNVGNTRQRRKWYDITIVRDFIAGIFDFVGLFFRTLTSSPATLESERVSQCYMHNIERCYEGVNVCFLHLLFFSWSLIIIITSGFWGLYISTNGIQQMHILLYHCNRTNECIL